jgi:hypothetical protein
VVARVQLARVHLAVMVIMAVVVADQQLMEMVETPV